MQRLLYFQQLFLVLLLKFAFLDGAAVTKETDNPFPFIYIGENGQVIVEAYPMEQDIAPSTKLDIGKTLQIVGNNSTTSDRQNCHLTYSILDGQSIQFRSRNYPLPSPDNMTSVTCFESPRGTMISLSCCNFNVDCQQNYFGVMFGNNDKSSSKIRRMCRNETFSQQISPSHYLAVIFASNNGSRSHIREESEGSSFQCEIAAVGSRSSGYNSMSTSPSPLKTSLGSCNCGKPSPQTKIVGGTVAQPNEFPWRCYIVTRRGVCGCTLISDEWAMTAAHCTLGVQRGTVILGAHQKDKGGIQMTTVPITRIINHPRYSSRTLFNDVALVKLQRKITFTKEISPVCLPWNMTNDDFRGKDATTSGWGSTRKYGYRAETSAVLRKVTLSVISHQECSRSWGRKVTSQMICARGPGKATCSGDSGGSLDLERNGSYYTVGITSWGDRCQGRKPDVFTRVTSFLGWIQSATREDFCK